MICGFTYSSSWCKESTKLTLRWTLKLTRTWCSKISKTCSRSSPYRCGTGVLPSLRSSVWRRSRSRLKLLRCLSARNPKNSSDWVCSNFKRFKPFSLSKRSTFCHMTKSTRKKTQNNASSVLLRKKWSHQKFRTHLRVLKHSRVLSTFRTKSRKKPLSWRWQITLKSAIFSLTAGMRLRWFASSKLCLSSFKSNALLKQRS